jgi:hypothetical protein
MHYFGRNYVPTTLGYKVDEKLHLGVREQKNTTAIRYKLFSSKGILFNAGFDILIALPTNSRVFWVVTSWSSDREWRFGS